MKEYKLHYETDESLTFLFQIKVKPIAFYNLFDILA